MTEFSLHESFWWLPLCLLLSTALTVGYYYFAYKGSFTAKQRLLLSSLRGVTIFLVLFLLLSPFVKYSFRKVEKPLLVLAIDNTASLSASSKPAQPSFLRKVAGLLKDKLQDKTEVRVLPFGNGASADTSLTGKEKQTNLSALFSDIDNAFEGRNLSSVVLLSDGIYNTGENPVYLSSLSAHPVFCLALGDTQPRRDVSLTAVRHNLKVFKGNASGIQAEVFARTCKGEQVKLELSENGNVLDSRILRFSTQEQSISAGFTITPATRGMHEYELKVVALPGESNLQNNSRKFFIEVVEERRNILLLADAPHPDLPVFIRALGQQDAIHLELQLAENFKGNFSPYQLVVFHNIPSRPSHLEWIQALHRAHKPALFVTGQKTLTGLFARTPPGNGFSQGSWIEALPKANTTFDLFTTEKKFSEEIAMMPPLQAFYNQGAAVPGSRILLYQQVGSVETSMPLLFYQSSFEGKYGYLCGEGIWKWSMQEFKNASNHDLTNGLIQKSVQYLISEDSNEPLQLLYEQRIKESENILIDARLFNQSRESVNEPELNINFTGNNRRYSFTFARSSSGYHLDAGFLPPGKYKLDASALIGNNKITQSGFLVVEPVFAELTDLLANHTLLAQISKKSGGKLFYPGQEEALAEEILSRSDIKPFSFYRKELRELLSFPLILLLLALLLSAEWFLRKRWGTV